MSAFSQNQEVIGFSHDTAVLFPQGMKAPLDAIGEGQAFGQKDLEGYALTYEGEIVRTRMGRHRGFLDRPALEIEINHDFTVIAGLRQGFYNQHGVLYRAEELRIGQHLGGVTPQMMANLKHCFEAKLHQSTGYFVVTGLKPHRQVQDLSTVSMSQHGSFVLACGLIAQSAQHH
jgi:hypothetical protein